nr:4606_t:CDS:2 [Entrophospora candida]
MPPIPKRKKQYKDQSRDAKGKYLSKRIYNVNSKVDETRQKENLKEKELDKLDITSINEKLNNENDGWDDMDDLVDDGDEVELDKLDVINNDEEWGNDDDSGWDDEEDIEEDIKINEKLKLDLIWKDDNLLERTKRGPYMKGKIPKSTYYDKFGPNGVFTKVARVTGPFNILTK